MTNQLHCLTNECGYFMKSWLIVSTVITSKDLKMCGNTWVCPESDHVCTRFLFVWVKLCHREDKNLCPPTVHLNTHWLFVFSFQVRKWANRWPVREHERQPDQRENFAGLWIEALLTLRLWVSSLHFIKLEIFQESLTRGATNDNRYLSGLPLYILTSPSARFSWMSFFLLLSLFFLFYCNNKHIF